ncbi:chemotaxis protein CheW [Hydrocarboniphaga sp.]|jgi:purine-binding chemotaxis protein CheW|uniref:chemotaxis protein CheW n=1 Tax=Hydrocarboniphaga sp. TaxID=2033016 RepID=UPI002ABC92C1|nr:chemotaxis protein CheW [Hydrocarboniphaga sp.]MDZ4077924.1 chemotaxis protein CheW [Hydrocarboniphaga sp.]
MQQQTRRHDDGDISRWVGFSIGEQSFALPIHCVREVNPSARYEAVPGAPRFVLGVAALRGRIVTVIDLHGRLQIERPADRARDPAHCLIVVESAGEMLALRVDAIGELYSLPSSLIKKPPAVAMPGTDDAVCGFVSRAAGERHMLSLLALDPLIDAVVPACVH